MGVAGDSPVEETAVSEQSVEFRVLELGWSKKPGGAEGEGRPMNGGSSVPCSALPEVFMSLERGDPRHQRPLSFLLFVLIFPKDPFRKCVG